MLSLIIILLILLLFIWFKYRFGAPKNSGDLVLWCGELKTGKTIASLYMAIYYYKLARLKWRIKKIFKKDVEEPLLYSNIPLKCKHVKITNEILERKVRLNYKSICFIDEISLLADSMTYGSKYKDLDFNLKMFIKLFSHSTRGGKLFTNTQSIKDNHFAIKRCIGRYYYIDKKYKYIPFYYMIRYYACSVSDGENITPLLNVHNEIDYKYMLIRKKYFKWYDCYCYSIFTDKLFRKSDVINGLKLKYLKAEDIPSFLEDMKKLKADKIN